jgi:hypothetical protein
MVRVFVSDVSSYASSQICAALGAAEHSVVGTLAPGGRAPKSVSELVASTDEEAAERLMLSADVIVLGLLDGVLQPATSLLHGLKRAELTGEKSVLVLSTVNVWGKTNKPKSGAGLKEENFTQVPPAPCPFPPSGLLHSSPFRLTLRCFSRVFAALLRGLRSARRRPSSWTRGRWKRWR